MGIIINVEKRMKAAGFTRFIDGQLLAGDDSIIDTIESPGGGSGIQYIPVTAYASDINGAGWTLTNSDTLDYQAWVILDATVTPVVGDFAGKWYRRKGLPGSSGTGTPGVDGQQAGFPINFSTATTATKPGIGLIKFNNANIALATAMYIDELTPGGADLSGMINALLKDGMSFLLRSNTASSSTMAVFELTADPTDNGDWFTIPVTNRLTSSTTFADGDQCTFQFFGGGGTGAVTEAAILAASAVVRIADAGGGTSKLIDTTNSTISSVSPVYKLSAFTITGVSNLPAANTFPHGAVVRLHQDCFVGAGYNPLGVMVQADVTNNIWRPFGPQILFQKNFGLYASPTCQLTAAGKFDLGSGGDPVFPAGLFNVDSRIRFSLRFKKVGATAVTHRINLGTDLTTRSNNSLAYTQATSVTADMDVGPEVLVTFISATTATAVQRLPRSSVAAGATADISTLLNIASAMKATIEASTLASDTSNLIAMSIIWEA